MTRDLPEFAALIATQAAPASGSAAAYALAMAAALLEKVARRSPGASVDVDEIQAMRTRALALMDDDELAVQKMLATGEAAGEATAVPRKIGRLAREIGDAADRLAWGGKPTLVADSRGAAALAQAAAAMVGAILASNAGADDSPTASGR